MRACAMCDTDASHARPQQHGSTLHKCSYIRSHTTVTQSPSHHSTSTAPLPSHLAAIIVLCSAHACQQQRSGVAKPASFGRADLGTVCAHVSVPVSGHEPLSETRASNLLFDQGVQLFSRPAGHPYIGCILR